MAQMPMYPSKVNSPITELAGPIDSAVDEIEVINGNALPEAPNQAVIGAGDVAETVFYTEKEGNIISGVTRGFQGTASSWPAGTKVARFMTAYDHDTFKHNIEDLQTQLNGLDLSADSISLDNPNFESDNVNDGLTELFTAVSDGKVSVAAAIADMNQIADGSMTFAQLAAKIRDISDDADAAAGDVLATKTFYQGGAKRTGTMPDRGNMNFTPGPTAQTIPAGKHGGSGQVAAVVVPADKVLSGTTIAGTPGTMPNRAGDTAALASSVAGTTLKLRASAGYRDGVDDNVTITDADFIAANIRNGINLFGLSGTLLEGKRYATGSYTPTGSKRFMRARALQDVVSQQAAEITGLNFPEGIAFIAVVHYSCSVFFVSPDVYISGFSSYAGGTGYVAGWVMSDGSGTAVAFRHDREDAYVTTSGFCLPVISASSLSLKWMVWGK